MVTVICPTYNEEKYIGRCIESMLAQDYPQSDMEVLFVDGMSTDDTRGIVGKYADDNPVIRLLDNTKKTVPYAMNTGIENARGEIIIRIDAHSSFPADYVSSLVKGLRELKADNVGVPCVTDVLNKTSKTLAIKEVLSHPLGVGNSYFRLGVDKITEVDTVPFGCYHRSVFDRFGKYDTRLVRNQDIELNKRIKKGGGRIYLLPSPSCTYYARESFGRLWKNNFQNGKWNILTVFYTGSVGSLSLRHFIPALFLLSIVGPMLLSILFFPFLWIAVASLGLYLSVLAVVCIRSAAARGINPFYLLSAFVILHFSYGLGSVVGLLKLPCIKNDVG